MKKRLPPPKSVPGPAPATRPIPQPVSPSEPLFTGDYAARREKHLRTFTDKEGK